MKIAFVHQNMPGQYKHLAAALAKDPGNQVVFVGRRGDRPIPGVRQAVYGLKRKPGTDTHRYLHSTENAVLHGQAVARVFLAMQRGGFVPDIVIGHPGWGETLFIKDLLPTVPLLSYCEFFYRARGQDCGFDPAFPVDVDSAPRLRMRSGPLLLALEACDQGVSPTRWQRSTHPQAFQAKIDVVHDGIDTAALIPSAAFSFTLNDGRVLTRDDEVVTFAVRNLEPYRGFHIFMRAVPLILAARPKATILIIGGDDVSYGSPPPGGGTWRERLAQEIEFDPARVHFLGHLPYDCYLAATAVARVHVYLTYPFVLSWSMLEMMSAGHVIVGSDTAPVREVITDGDNGLLVDFFSQKAIADRVAAVLAEPESFAHLGRRARETVMERYDLPACLARQMELVRGMAGKT